MSCAYRKPYRLFIRPYCSRDVDSHYEAVKETQSDLGKWFSWCDCDKEYVRKYSENYIEDRAKPLGRDGKYDFAIINCDTEELLGAVLILGFCEFAQTTPSRVL